MRSGRWEGRGGRGEGDVRGGRGEERGGRGEERGGRGEERGGRGEGDVSGERCAESEVTHHSVVGRRRRRAACGGSGGLQFGGRVTREHEHQLAGQVVGQPRGILRACTVRISTHGKHSDQPHLFHLRRGKLKVVGVWKHLLDDTSNRHRVPCTRTCAKRTALRKAHIS